MGYYETYEEGKERWVSEPGDPVNIHGVSYDPNDPWSNWVNAAGQLDVPGWQENLDNAQRLVEEQGLPFGANEQRGGFSRFFNPSTGEWPIEYHARQENAGPFGLPSWTAPLFALAAVGTAGAGSALLGPAAGAAGAAAAPTAAAAPAAASAASLFGIPTSTLSTIGTIGSLGGTAANVLGGLTGQEWLQKLGLGLGVAGGLSGGLAGLGNVLGTGVNSLSDAARLASSAGKITGAVGRASGVGPLQQASRYLGLGGNVGNLASGAGNLLSAADVATQRGGGGMADDWGNTDWLNWSGGGEGALLSDTGPGIDWGSFTSGGPGSWAGQVTTDWANGPDDTGGGGGGLWNTILGGLGGAGKMLLGGGVGGSSSGGLLGPLLSSLGSIGGGAIGSNAANEAARLQAAAANRGLDLQTSMWLSNLERQQPWLEAGRGALSQLAGLSGQGAPAFNQPGMPGTQPFQYSGPGMPGTGFQYTGAGMPSTGFQYSGPGMPGTGFQYTGPGMPTQDFKAPTWEELKARDPGIAARLAEGQKAIDTSAAARGNLLSGTTLGALQRQGQTLASAEYAPAYQRALGEYQQEYGQDWQRQQEAYQRQRAENELLYGRGYQQQGDIYGRQLAENQLGYNRQWQQQMTDYERQLAQNQLGYGRGMEQYRQGYGEQAAMNQQDYGRNQALYGQQYQQMMDQYNAQLASQAQQWNRLASLSGTGQTAVSQLGTAGQNNATQMASLLSQLGQAQSGGTVGGANAWMNALQNIGNAGQGYLQNQSLLSALSNLNR